MRLPAGSMVGMKEQVVANRLLKDRLVAGTAPVRRGCFDQQRSAASVIGFPVLST